MRTADNNYSGIANALIPYYRDIDGYDEKAIKKFIKDKSILLNIKDILNGINDWNESSIDEALKEYQSKNDLSVPAVNQPIRIALTGSTKSPSLGLTLVIFGKNQSIERIDKLLNTI
jgi:glutamyl-tRNA synthetase